MNSARGLLAGQQVVGRTVSDGGVLTNDSEGYFLIFLRYFLLLSKTFFVHREHVLIFGFLSFTLFDVYDFVEQDLVF